MFPRQGEQCLIVIISYMGYSPSKCTCNGNQTHSRKYMILLECLHDMDENATHPFPLLEPSLTPSRMPKPNVRKIQFSKQEVFVLENIIPSFGKYIELPSEVNFWVIFPKQSWVRLRDELLDNSPRQFFEKSSLKFLSQPFLFFFHFLSCHALTPIVLGCPGAYGMHYAISKPFMSIYQLCIY